MMPYVVGLLAAGCVMLLVVAMYELATTPTRAVARELDEIKRARAITTSPSSGR